MSLLSPPAIALGLRAINLEDAVTVALPRATRPPATERILVVEDEPSIRDCLVRQLFSLGYAVSQASDGMAGISAFEAAADPYDLLLTDLMMPGTWNGRALADVVGTRWPSTKVVFMSGYPEHDLLGAGAVVLKKPFRKLHLAEAVRQALS